MGSKANAIPFVATGIAFPFSREIPHFWGCLLCKGRIEVGLESKISINIKKKRELSKDGKTLVLTTVLQLLMGTHENKHGNNLISFKITFSCCAGNYCLFIKNQEDAGTAELIDGSQKAKVRTMQTPRDEGRGLLLSKKFPTHKGTCGDPPLRGRKHLKKHLPPKGGLSQHCPESMEPATIFGSKWKGLWLFLIEDTDAGEEGCEVSTTAVKDWEQHSLTQLCLG